jgi:hypothetical protein
MPSEVIPNLIHNVGYTWFFALFFLAWPFVLAFGGVILTPPSHGVKIGLGGALYRSWATYLGFDGEASNSAAAEQRWLLLCHRLLGALAWAYTAAIFITSIG